MPPSRPAQSVTSTATACASSPGWAIPEEQAGEIVNELLKTRSEFQEAKEAFLAVYDQSIQAWVEKHQQWGDIIRNSTVGPEYVRARMDFRWQMFKVAPLMEHPDNNAVLEAGLADAVTGLGSTLFGEIARTADDIWRRVYVGRTEVTHKALSPLKPLYNKLVGLSFVEPHVSPMADIIHTAIRRMPARGNITGADLLLLQGLVCLLRDSNALLTQAQTLMEGYGPASVLDSLLASTGQADVALPPAGEALFADQAEMAEGAPLDTVEDMDEEMPDIPEIPANPPPKSPETSPNLASYGLW